MIHDGSSSPSLTLPHSMGEGEGGGGAASLPADRHVVAADPQLQ